jgi:hypothetical protein
MNDEFESIWKEAVMTLPRYCPGICLEGLRKRSTIRIAAVPAKIQTEHLPNVRVGRYRYVKPFGFIVLGQVPD